MILSVDCLSSQQHFYVVTTEDHAVLPSLAGSGHFTLPRSDYCTWGIEIHGTYLRVDDATNSTGMLDPFSSDSLGLFFGPKNSPSTSYTAVGVRYFTARP